MPPTLMGKDTAEVFVRRGIDGTYQAWISLRLLVIGVQMAIFKEGKRKQVRILFVALLVVKLKDVVIIVVMVLVIVIRVMVEQMRVSSTPGIQGSTMDIVLGFVLINLVVSFVSFTDVLLFLWPHRWGCNNCRDG